MTREQIKDIEEHMDNIYVRQKYCLDKQEEINNKLARDDKRIDLIAQNVEFMRKLGWIIASAVIGQLVVSLFSVMR